MRKGTIGIICGLICLILFFSPVQLLAEEFTPLYYFNGSINISVDSYYGNYPDDPIVKIPEGITDPDELKEWEGKKREDEDVRRIFKLSNPTVPGIAQSINLGFYANPVPDFEVFIDLSHNGLWGGGGTRTALESPLMIRKAYVQYYTDNAMITLGRYDYELGPLGVLLANPFSSKEGIMVHTMFKDYWVTVTYNRLLMSMYKEYPYVSGYLLDDMLAGRISKRVGSGLLGLNLIANGLYDEKGLSIDYNGKLWGKTVVAELAVIYPAWVFRDLFADHVWPGGVVSMNLIEDMNQVLTVRFGVYTKGFISQYGKKAQSGMEGVVKFTPNTGGFDLVYQRGLTDDLVFGANLFITDYLDRAYQYKLQSRYDVRTLELKLHKYLSQVSDIRLSTYLINDDRFTYGKTELSWGFKF